MGCMVSIDRSGKARRFGDQHTRRLRPALVWAVYSVEVRSTLRVGSALAVIAAAAFAGALPPARFVRDHCLFVNTSGHCMRSELGFATRTPEKMVQACAASGKDTLVLYFHGGLVASDAALEELASLDRKAFAPAGGYTLGIVWNSDAVTMAQALAGQAGSAFSDPVDVMEGVRLGRSSLGSWLILLRAPPS